MILSFSLLKINAQGIPENDNLLIDKDVSTKIIVEKTKIPADTMGKVFTGTFYKVDITVNVDNGSSSDHYYYVVKDGKLTELENNNENREMKTLFSLLRNDFYLKSDGDVKVFETCLDKLYPLDWSDKPETRQHIKTGNKWYFVRGKFFDSKKAFVITLDQNSRITQIDFNLDAVKK
jgi:hypothetical protein